MSDFNCLACSYRTVTLKLSEATQPRQYLERVVIDCIYLFPIHTTEFFLPAIKFSWTKIFYKIVIPKWLMKK